MQKNVYIIENKIDYNNSFLWQYDNAERMKMLVKNQRKFTDVATLNFYNEFYKNIFNVKTANNFGLLVWGTLLGVSRPTWVDYNEQTVDFTDEMYRTLLLARMMLYNANTSVDSLNNYLKFLFPNKLSYVVNYYDMSIRIIFYYSPTREEIAILFAPNFLPIPVGVMIEAVIIPPEETFGFFGSGLSGFDQGSFVNLS